MRRCYGLEFRPSAEGRQDSWQGCALPFFEYRGQFRSEGFQSEGPRCDRDPFRIIFAGRAERNKGILDIAAIAERLRERSQTKVLFEVCGGGGALTGAKANRRGQGAGDIVRIHGQLRRPQLLEVYARAHAVIVPTRNDFCEGLPKTCAEAVLSGLPIITSRLKNAMPVLGPQ